TVLPEQSSSSWNLSTETGELHGEPAGLRDAIVLRNVFSGPGDGQQVEQSEVVEPQHLHQFRRRALGLRQFEPAVELLLRQARGAVDAADAVLQQCRIVTLRHEYNLIAQVGHAV